MGGPVVAIERLDPSPQVDDPEMRPRRAIVRSVPATRRARRPRTTRCLPAGDRDSPRALRSPPGDGKHPDPAGVEALRGLDREPEVGRGDLRLRPPFRPVAGLVALRLSGEGLRGRGEVVGAAPRRPRSTPCRQGASRAPPPRGRGRPASFGAARAPPPGHSGWGGAGPSARRANTRSHPPSGSPPASVSAPAPRARRRTRRRSNRRPRRISRAAASTSPSESSRGLSSSRTAARRPGSATIRICNPRAERPERSRCCTSRSTSATMRRARSPDSPEGKGRESAQRQGGRLRRTSGAGPLRRSR